MEIYYNRSPTFGDFQEQVLREDDDYQLKRITIQSDAGDIVIDYFKRPERSDSVVLVFPVLGGKPVIENYFADYFARYGFDTAIVHRDNDFKDPSKIDQIEELFRSNVIRDRYALDFFEKHYQKRKFGSFGISRGAINASITAGIDDRLKHNVLVLGGSDLVKMFEKSNQKRIKKYVNSVMAQKNITKAQFFASLQKSIKTDPKNFARYIDARNTLMILGVFDRTVPFKYGELLREQIGDPKTIYLMADHYLSLLYTQFFKLMPPGQKEFCLFPFDYVETEALAFYRSSMETRERTFKLVPYKLIGLPFDLIGRALRQIF
ncbi:MAG: hypothetical protein J5J00_12190 [Deltaproteobacteria bacterium]|nr:hypothetical protein [Deltaproteobacteria bacterium]